MSCRYSYNYPQAARDAGFKLRQYADGILDWRLIGSLEIERLLREQNLDQIDDVLGHLSEVPLGTLLETNILDSGIAKFFILSQFAVQYLLFCRTFLEDTINDLRESFGSSQLQIAQLKRSLSESNNEIIQMHKKMSQMEAIHEVIYPCHLCTKNFISNDALNLHITRKHDNKMEKRREALTTGSNSATSIQNREITDLNLINTIKLELEIKQLKERLNNAERDIKELPSSNYSKKSSAKKSDLPSPASSADVSLSISPILKAMKPSYKSIGIQNNLMETKEQNDGKDFDSEDINRSDCGDTPTRRPLEQAILEEVLHSKLQAFEIWKDQQQRELQEFLNEINQKLHLISTALESQKTQCRETNTQGDHLNELSKTSIAALENRLTTKIDDIGQRNIDKIQIAVNQIQLNYQEKLEELKDELMKIISIEKLKVNTHREPQKQEIHEMTKDMNATTPLTTDEEANKSINSLDDYNDNTYDIENANIIPSSKSLSQRQRTLSENGKTSSRSDLQTTVKETNKHLNPNGHETTKPNAKAEDKHIKNDVETNKTAIRTAAVAGNDDKTDVSDNLQTDDDTDQHVDQDNKGEDHDVDDNSHYKRSHADQRNDKTFTVHYHTKTPTTSDKGNYQKPEQNNKYQPLKEAKPVMRSEVKRLFNNRLKSYNLNIKTESISNGAMKRTLNDIHKHRNQLKKEYKNFTATRNHLKKFVNKLCSNKMSTSAENLMKKTQPKQSLYQSKLQNNSQLNESQTDEDTHETNDDDDDDVRASTPLNESTSMNRDEFKQKLEKILSSPINKPNRSMNNIQSHHLGQQFEYQAMVHKEMAAELKPVPLPRKKVMFSEQNLKTTKSSNLLYHSDSGSPKKPPSKWQQLSSSLDNLP